MARYNKDMHKHSNIHTRKARTVAKAIEDKRLKILIFTLFFISILFVAFSANAQESADDVLAGQGFTAQAELSDDMKTRMDLATQMHQIWPIRVKVEKGLNQVSAQMTFSERAKFKAAMRRAIDFEELEKESIKTMAETFNANELKGMVDFYGSPAGRAVSAKVDVFQEAIEPVYVRMLDKALLDIRTGIQD